MLIKIFKGKVARFAILMLFIFLLAQSGVARAQEETPDVQVAREILLEASRQMGYIYEGEVDVFGGQSKYYMGLGVENGPDFFAEVFPTEAAARQWIDDNLRYYKISGTAITFHDHPGFIIASGPYEDGHYLYSLAWAMQNFGFHCQATDGNPPACAEALYAVASQRLGQETSVGPGPIIDPEPNPNPNPNPEPSPIDPQVISILQSILSTPILPITGAAAGGLVAWVISMLGGGRTVLPPPPRPPTGSLRPGQVGQDGRIWSPGQGWVSKSTIDYQQKWLQKGWRLNPKTNQLEVQPGAVNESGQVWYKLPHEMDEGDSHYWVDKAKAQECERNLNKGMVWDHNLGWQTAHDLKQNKSDQDAIRQRSRQYSKEKNSQIQQEVKDANRKRQEEYQNWLKQYEHKEQVLQNMDAAQDEFRRQRAIDNKLALKHFLLKSAAFPVDGADAIGARMCPSIGEIYQGAYDGVKETASEIKEIYQGAYDGAKEVASDVKEIYQGAYDGAKEVASDLKEIYQGAYNGVKEAASDLKDLVYHDGVQEELRKKLSGKISDWTTKFTKNAASKYTDSPIKKQLFDTYGKPALQESQGVGSTLKDKAFEAAAGDFPEKAVDLVMDQVEKHPELIR